MLAQVECGGNRKDLSLLTEAVQGAVREAAGSECLALCISAMVEQAASLVRVGLPSLHGQLQCSAASHQPLCSIHHSLVARQVHPLHDCLP